MQTVNHLATAGPLIPLKVGYEYDRNLAFQHSLFPTRDGYRFILDELFRQAKDLALNKDSLLVLTSSQNLSSFMIDTPLIDVPNFGVYEAILFVFDNTYLNVIDDTLYSTANALADAVLLKMLVNSDDTVSFLYNGKLLTVDRNLPHGLTFQEELPFTDQYNQQKFKLNFVGEQYLTISTIFTSPHISYSGNIIFERFFTKGEDGKVYALGAVQDDDYIIDNPYLFQFTNLNKAFFSSTGFENQITWVDYFNSSLPTTHNKDVIHRNKHSDININFLVDNPLKTKINLVTDNDDLALICAANYFSNLSIGQTDVNIANLKNVMHAKYNSIKLNKTELTPISSNNSNLIHRNYERVFAGQREEEGFDTPFLSYSTNLKEIILLPDSETYFHYPEFSPFNLPLSSSNLIECGAVAGNIPYASDKVYMINADYKDYIHWGDSQRIIQNGVWLCAWLSGSSLNKPVWKDRWYNPGFIDSVSATFVYSNSAVYDVDSEIKFYPGVWYKYFHVGDNHNTLLVNQISSNMLIFLQNELIDDLTIKDLTLNDNNGFLSSPELVQTVKVNDKLDQLCMNFKGTSDEYCQILNNNTLNPSGDFTMTIWGKSDDWLNIPTCNIAGTYFRGGFGLRINNGIDTPLYCIANNSGFFSLTNNENKRFAYLSTDIFSTYDISDLVLDKDQYVWCLDVHNNAILRIDFDGVINRQINLSDYTGTFSQLVISGSDNICTVNDTGVIKQVIVYNSQFGFLSSISIPLSTNRIDFDTQLNLVALSGNDITIDNENVVWHLSDNNTLFYNLTTNTGFTGSKIICKKNNNILLVQEDKVIETDNQFDIINQTTYVFDNTIQKGFLCNRYINHDQDYLYILDGSNIVVFDQNLQYYTTINYSEAISPFIVGSDPSNYQWQRKNEWIRKLNTLPSLELIRTKRIDVSNGFFIQDTTVTYPLSNLNSNEFYLLAGRYDSGSLQLFVNSNLVGQSVATDENTYYRYRSSLLLGTQAGKSDQLNNLLKIESGRSFKGLLHEFRFYDESLNNTVLYDMYRTKFDYKPIKWQALTNTIEYIEEVERFFKNKLPGSKSQYFNIRLTGLNITDRDVQIIIEDIIKNTLKKIVPVYCELFKIIWE